MKSEYRKRDLKNKRDLLAQKRREKRSRLKPFLDEIRTDIESSTIQDINVFEDGDVKITSI